MTEIKKKKPSRKQLIELAKKSALDNYIAGRGRPSK